MNLRERVEADLSFTLEGLWALPVTLIDPDGNIVSQTVTGAPLGGQVLYDTIRVNPATGEEMIVNKPVVTLKRSSLSRVPEPGEKWIVKIPVTPSTTAPLEDFIIDATRSSEGGSSIGFIRLYLRRARQTP